MARQTIPFDRETVNLETVARVLGISRPVVYDAARRDALPVPVIRIGRRMVVSRQALDDLLNARKPAAPDDTAA